MEGHAESVVSLNRVDLANRLFHDYFVRCFWHWKPDLRITEAMIPDIVNGLRANGGHKGMLAASHLASRGSYPVLSFRPSFGSDFRFFPCDESNRYHPADQAIDKAIALVSCPTIRDYVDIVHLDAQTT